MVSARNWGAQVFSGRDMIVGAKSELGVVTMSPAGGAGRWPEFTQGPGQKVDGETQNQGPGKVKQSGLEEAMGPVDSLSHILL